jgi:protein TonB
MAAPRPREQVRVVVVEKPPPPEAPPPPIAEPPKLARPTRAPRPKVPPPPAPTPVEPQPVPAPAPADKPPPLLVPGLGLSSTSSTGSFAVPTGNTLNGRPGAGSPDAESGGGSAGRGTGVAPAYALTEEPVFLDNVSPEEVRRFYPEAARKEKIEAVVRASLTIDAEGRVVRAVVTSDPGHGFGEAATRLARRYRFKPARVDGRPVATEISFTIRFVLDQ